MTRRASELPDPISDGRVNYEYSSSEASESGIAADLRSRVRGPVAFDTYTRQLYATDASIYEVLPIGVVKPTDTEDVSAVLEYCYERDIPVLPRGGGTSLAGQTVNEAVVLDFKAQMDEFHGLDEAAETARAQVGITLAELNTELEPAGLKYAPDPAWGDKSVLGGCIGNNSTGAHSLQYGKADKYVESLEVVLADGTVTEFGWMDRQELRSKGDPEGDLESRFYAEIHRILEEDAQAIEANYPDLKRNVSGYNFDVLLDEAQTHDAVNVARLFAGSEGTLGVITAATVSLEPIPETTSIAMLAYDDVLDAMEDVGPILEHDPSAVEVMDDVFLDLAADRDQFRDLIALLPSGTDSTLLVEFYADSDHEAQQKVADLVADRVPDAETELEPSSTGVSTGDETRAFDVIEAYSESRQAEFWKMRKAGLPILLSNTGDDRHWPFIEDTAIPAESLRDYVRDFQDLLEAHDTFATYYAHAGPGVLHIRPLLDLTSETGIQTMEEIADAVTDLVLEYDGSVSGEHGDGRARTQWNQKVYGADLWESFRSLKRAIDPTWILNPGPVCGTEDGSTDMTANLRFGPEQGIDPPFDPELHWDTENGFAGMASLCHGCGGCTGYQESTGGVMCPTYRAAEEEILSTRGRANLLRSAMNGNLPDELLSERFVHEVLDLCLSCKGCKTDCPSGVDMAKLKAEVLHEYKERNGVKPRDKLFANVGQLLSLGSSLAPASNWLLRAPGTSFLQERFGIAGERTLPEIQSTTLRDWFQQRGGSRVPKATATRSAILVPDPYTNYLYTERGKAAVEVLEATGVHVTVSKDVTDSGRAAYSKALLDSARETARETVGQLAPKVAAGWDIVSVEPSASVMFQDDYLDLLSGPNVETVAENTYSIFEYLDTFDLDENLDVTPNGNSLTYHGNCLHKGTGRDGSVTAVLERRGFRIDELDSTCCGMAGSFGYESEHYSMSKTLMTLLESQIEASPFEDVVVTGASCTMQVGDMPSREEKPDHAIQRLADALD